MSAPDAVPAAEPSDDFVRELRAENSQKYAERGINHSCLFTDAEDHSIPAEYDGLAETITRLRGDLVHALDDLSTATAHRDRARADRAALIEERDRMAAALHRAQKHPDWEYAVTYGDGSAHKPMTGWVRNPAAVDVSGVRPPAVFWMRPRTTTAADVADLVPPAAPETRT